jgi:hypothetical protein
MTITSIDFETANPSRVSICAAGMAVFEDGKLTEAPYWLVRPPKPHGWFLPDFIEIHHLTHLDVLDAPEFPAIAPEFLARLTRADLVIAHNAHFDLGHLRDTLDHFGLTKPEFDYVCTDGVCFQIYNAQGDEVLMVLEEMRTDNGLAISKRYFFFRIFQVFQHLHLNTQLCELGKSGVATLENIENAEVGTYLMDAFNQAAKEILG